MLAYSGPWPNFDLVRGRQNRRSLLRFEGRAGGAAYDPDPDAEVEGMLLTADGNDGARLGARCIER